MRFFSSTATMPFVPPQVLALPLDSIAIFRAGGVTEAWIERGSARISDTLNRGLPLEVRLSLLEAPRALATDGIIALAVQVPLVPSANRMSRRRHVLEMSAPPYRVRGTVHMPPGADPVRYLRATSQRWTAVTKATIHSGGDGEGYQIDVLLVNMEHVSR